MQPEGGVCGARSSSWYIYGMTVIDSNVIEPFVLEDNIEFELRRESQSDGNECVNVDSGRWMSGRTCSARAFACPFAL